MKCTGCGSEVDGITCTINPRKAVREFRTSCGHEVTEDEARTAWRLKIPLSPIPLPIVDGGNLIVAERRRHTTEEGHTPDKDAELAGSELAWSAWCLLDRAAADRPVEQAPSVWPLARDRWPATRSPLRLLIIAGSFIAAEIDRRLAKGETP